MKALQLLHFSGGMRDYLNFKEHYLRLESNFGKSSYAFIIMIIVIII